MQHEGSLYFIWSGWEGDVDVSQQLYIAPMSDPFTVCGERTCISRPEHDWECHGRPTVNEGPEVLKKDGTVHIVYSASGSWTDDYCLGLLTLTGPDPLDPAGAEDWIVYHANEVSGSGWRGRSVRAQKFGWDGTTPVFGSPVKTGTEQVMAD